MDAATLRTQLLSGDLVDLRAGQPELDDLAAVDQWDSERDVPADLLVDVLTGPVTDPEVRRRVQLAGARITGQMDLHSATLNRSLLLRQCVLTAPMALEDADVLALGFPGTSVPGLNAAGMRCRGSVDLSDGFTAEGEVWLIGAHIRGQLNCAGGTFRNPGGRVLTADGLTVDQSVHCRDGFTAEGEVRLVGAHIRGQLNCTGGAFRNPGGRALVGDVLTVDGAMVCRDGFTAEGEVRLLGAHIGHNLDCIGGTFHNPDGLALDLERAEIQGHVQMLPAAFDGGLDLTFARVGVWQDNPRTWPKNISLNGFTYTTIRANPPTVVERLSWLRRDPAGYLPNSYEQLAASYRRKGGDAQTQQVLIAKQRHRRASHPSWWRRWPAIAWSAVLHVTIGYGYRPWLVVPWAAGLFLSGWWVFARDYHHHEIVPKADNPAGLTFNAARYTADLLLPVANLSERAKFTAVGDAAWHAFFYTLAGWLLAIVLVAGLTGVFKRD